MATVACDTQHPGCKPALGEVPETTTHSHPGDFDDPSEGNTTINPAAWHQAKHCNIPIYLTATHSGTWGKEAEGGHHYFLWPKSTGAELHPCTSDNKMWFLTGKNQRDKIQDSGRLLQQDTEWQETHTELQRIVCHLMRILVSKPRTIHPEHPSDPPVRDRTYHLEDSIQPRSSVPKWVVFRHLESPRWLFWSNGCLKVVFLVKRSYFWPF